MRTKPIIIIGAVVAVLFLTAIVFIGARPFPSGITVRHLKSVQSGGWVAATFEFTNHTDQNYLLDPLYVEARNGVGWPIAGPFSSPILGPHRSATATFNITNLAAGCAVHLRVLGNKESAGLERFFMRLNMRFRQGQKSVSLNPLDEGLRAFSKPTVIVSDEFVAPESK